MKQIAVHESGHVVIAKALGYSCELMRIDRATQDAFSSILWGDDEIVINSFLRPQQFGVIFNGLPRTKRSETFQIAGRYIMILSSGSTAEAYFIHKEDIDNGRIQHLPIEMGAGDPLLRTDIDKIEKTETFLRSVGLGIPLDTRENQLLTMFVMIQRGDFFRAIDELSDVLLHSPLLTINRDEIENCLNNFNLTI